MSGQVVRERSFVFEHGGKIYKYVEKIMIVADSEPTVTIDLTEDQPSGTSRQETPIQRLGAAIEDDWIIIGLSSPGRDSPYPVPGSQSPSLNQSPLSW